MLCTPESHAILPAITQRLHFGIKRPRTLAEETTGRSAGRDQVHIPLFIQREHYP